MAHGGNRMDRASVLQARERERQVLQLFLRGLSWVEIAKQLGFAHESGARVKPSIGRQSAFRRKTPNSRPVSSGSA
jgi:FixJ family two-component response regulator